VLRVPPGDTHVPGAGTGKGAKARKPLTDAQLELADRIVLHRDPSAIVINKPPGLATQGGSGTLSMSMACSMPMRPMALARVWSTVSTRTPAARCWSPPRRAARPISRGAFPRVRPPRSIGRW
jgi:hypothetical protein